VNAEKDLSFLKNGIYDMLASRLSRPGKVQVIERKETENALETITGSLTEEVVRKTGEKLNVDFVLFGSLTVFGNSISIDAKMVDVSANAQTLSFFDHSQSMDEVIPRINTIAANINEKIFGRVIVSKQLPVQPKKEQTEVQPEQPNVRLHPEKLFKKDRVAYDNKDGTKMEDSPFISTRESGKASTFVWKSRNFKSLFNGLALGDVDGDGKIEIVIITPHEVNLYRFENNRLSAHQKIGEHKRKHFIGVDIADVNGNGYPEIFVTSLNPFKTGISSFVLEYNGQKYVKIIQNFPWYFRVVELPGRSRILLGQKNSSANPFSGKIYKMLWENSDYVPGEAIKTPRRSNLMGLTLSDMNNSGENVVVAYSESDEIRIMNQSGDELWEGTDPFGGSTLYFALPLEGAGDIENRKYLPMRIWCRDVNSDGKPEVIAVNNHGKLSRLLDQFRKFTKSHIESLTWDGLGLMPFWRTPTISGHVRDFFVGDFNNDGTDELVAAVILKEGSIIGTTPKSTVIAYKLNE
jgi:TolB-like protein